MNLDDAKARLRTTGTWLKKSATEASAKVSEVVREAQAEKVVSATCPTCEAQQEVVIGGGIEGKIRAVSAVAGAATLGVTGAVVGAGIGLASGGAGMPATVPLGAGGAVTGALIGDRAGDWIARSMRATNCGECGGPLVLPKKV